MNTPIVLHDMENTQEAPLILYTWPEQWGLPSLDPLCLAAIIYMRLALPEGRFQTAVCTDLDASPSGAVLESETSRVCQSYSLLTRSHRTTPIPSPWP
jgi:hypothetical protein